MNRQQQQAIREYKAAHKPYQAQVDENYGHFSPDILRALRAAEDNLIDAMMGEGAAGRAKSLGGYCRALSMAKERAGIN